MDKKYCDQCGQELDIGAKFCSSCGAESPSIEKETIGTKIDKVIDKTKSNNNSLFDVKILGLGIIALLVIVVLAFTFSNGIGIGSNAVDVTSVGLDHKYFNAAVFTGDYDERPIKGILEFNFMPNEYLERVTGIGLQNMEITYADGQKQNVGSGVFEEHYNTYEPNQEYSFSMEYVVDLYTKADDNINAYFNTTHIKADIVINTTDQTNKVIGHIDNDVTPPSK